MTGATDVHARPPERQPLLTRPTLAPISFAWVAAATAAVPPPRISRSNRVMLLTSAVSPSVPTLYLAWIVIGVAMAATLYEPAMVVLVDLDPSCRRWTPSVLTAAGGLASTVFAPLTAALTDALGWRAAIAVLAIAVSALTGIVHLCCLPGRSARPPDQVAGADHQAPLTRDLRRLRTAVLVEQTAYVATSAQLVGFLTARAVPLHTASAVLGTIGLGKLAGRLLLPGISRHRSLRNLAVACSLVHLVGLAVPLATTGTVGLFAAAVVVGTASGASTVLRSLLVVDLAGTTAFAGVSARLQRASSLVRAAGPFALGLGVASLGWNTTWVLALAAFASPPAATQRSPATSRRRMLEPGDKARDFTLLDLDISLGEWTHWALPSSRSRITASTRARSTRRARRCR